MRLCSEFISHSALLVRRSLLQRKHSWYTFVAETICRTVSECPSVRKEYCGKTAEWIRMPFEVISGVGCGMCVLEGVHMPQEEAEEWEIQGFCSPLVWGVNRHFQAKCAKYSHVHCMETTARIPSKFCIPDQ